MTVSEEGLERKEESVTWTQPSSVSFTRWSGMSWWISRFLLPSLWAWRIRMIICEGMA